MSVIKLVFGCFFAGSAAMFVVVGAVLLLLRCMRNRMPHSTSREFDELWTLENWAKILFVVISGGFIGLGFLGVI